MNERDLELNLFMLSNKLSTLYLSCWQTLPTVNILDDTMCFCGRLYPYTPCRGYE